eukprot:SAG22_NODE_2498_length_2508_cov_1.539228_1_plen_414_part_01
MQPAGPGLIMAPKRFDRGMTPEQRYLFDLNGFLAIPGAVPEPQLVAARAALDEGAAFVYTADPRLGVLAFNAAAWPVIMELSGGGAMIRIGSGIHNPAYPGTGSGGGGPLHCNREHQRSSSIGSPTMARYAVRNGKIFCTDFLAFIYLDPVRPGDGGLCLVHGSHRARFERPPSLFGTFGTGNFTVAGTGVQPDGFVSAPHPTDGLNRGPAHTVNPCVQAGDIIIMSECTSHATLPWLSTDGPRRVLGVRFKPQHAHQPEDGLTAEQILQLSPEIRELRRYAPLGIVKGIATAAGPPDRLSPPNGAPVTADELTAPMGRPSQSGHGDADRKMMWEMRAAPTPQLPEVAGGLTPEQRYLLDIHGYIQLGGVLGHNELAACQAAAEEYTTTPTDELPDGFGRAGGSGAMMNAHAFS